MNKQIENNEHVSIDDMMDFFSINKVSPETIRFMARINSHIMKCEECRKQYDALRDANETLDKIVSYIPESQKIKLNMIKGVYYFENERADRKKGFQECVNFIKDITFSIKLKVMSFSELGWESITGGYSFFHPAFAASSKSVSEINGNIAEGTIKSTLVDDDSNRISIGIDRTLSLFLNKNECLTNSIVILIPTEASMQPYFEYAQTYDDKTVVVRFDDIEPGDYIVAFKE